MVHGRYSGAPGAPGGRPAAHAPRFVAPRLALLRGTCVAVLLCAPVCLWRPRAPPPTTASSKPRLTHLYAHMRVACCALYGPQRAKEAGIDWDSEAHNPLLVRAVYGARPPKMILLARDPIRRLYSAFMGYPHYYGKYGACVYIRVCVCMCV